MHLINESSTTARLEQVFPFSRYEFSWNDWKNRAYSNPPTSHAFTNESDRRAFAIKYIRLVRTIRQINQQPAHVFTTIEPTPCYSVNMDKPFSHMHDAFPWAPVTCWLWFTCREISLYHFAIMGTLHAHLPFLHAICKHLMRTPCPNCFGQILYDAKDRRAFLRRRFPHPPRATTSTPSSPS